MSILNRLRESLRADAHGLVDQIQEPTLLLKQHLRDAESELHAKRARIAELQHTTKRLTAERQRAEQELARAEVDADLAIQGGREDLARYALRLALTQRNLIERLTRNSAEYCEEQRELARVLAAQEVTLEELRGRVQAFVEAREHGECGASSFTPVTDEQVEIELLRRKATGSSSGGESRHE